MSSRASIGGSAAAGGATFQDEVFAWACAALVAEQPLPTPMPPRAVVRVGAQTGYAVDDVAIETAANGLALCQVKARLPLGTTPTSPLADALEQVVAQYLAGMPSRTGLRRATPGHDLIAIVTDAGAPKTVRVDLATAISRTATLPPGTPLGETLTSGQSQALEVASTHIRRSWASHQGTAPTDEDVRGLLGVVAVIVVDTVDGGRDSAAAQATMRGFVPPGEEPKAWHALVTVGRDAAIAREWRERATLVAAVARQGVTIGPGPSAAADIALLRAATISNLTALKASSTLPLGSGLHLNRLVDSDLASARPADGGVVVVGEAGSGKTGVVVTLAAARAAAGQDVVLLRAADLAAGTVSGSTRSTLPLDQVLLSWTGVSPATVVIDALDAARGGQDRARLAELVTALADSRWQVIATVRTYDLLYGPVLRAAFPGAPASSDSARRDPRLDGVRHIRVDDLTDAEIAPITGSATPVADFYAAAPPELRKILRNPFNLRLAAELLAAGVSLSHSTERRLTSAKTRLDLLGAYWEHRVDAAPDGFARADVLTRITESMLRRRQLRALAAPPTVIGTDSGAVTGLLSDNVLAVEDQSSAAARRILVFAHHILFDYTAMRCVLHDPLVELQLVQRLDADQSLPLVARPSLDMLFDALWQRGGGREGYWRLAIALAASPHLLASLSGAARLAAAGPSPEDLRPLAAACTGPEPDLRDAGYAFLSQLVGVVRAPVTSDTAITVASSALAELAADLSNSALAGAPNWQCLGSVLDLLNALRLRRPLTGSQPEAKARARAVVNVLDACRTDPVQFERLAIAAAGHLKDALTADASYAGAVARLLDDPNAVKQWGGRLLADLAAAIPQLAAADPALASRVAESVWRFQETRDESVGLGGSPLLPLTESRTQQAQHARWELGRIYPELCRTHFPTAATIFAAIADVGISPGQADDAALWPLLIGDVRGWLTYGSYLETLGGHDTGPAMAGALRDALADAGTHQRETGPILEIVVSTLHSAAAWAVLLTPAGDAEGLATAVQPLLATGSLLAHPDTHEAAGTLLRTLAARADDALHSQLEEAVRAAADRAAALGTRRERIVDELLGCLDPARVTGEQEAARLATLALAGGPPPLTPRLRVESRYLGRNSLLDRLDESGATVSAEQAAAVEKLDEAVYLVGSGGTAEEVQAAQDRMPDLFLAADSAGAAGTNTPAEVRLLMVRTAAMLADHNRVLPDTALGDRVLAVLRAAASSDNDGHALS